MYNKLKKILAIITVLFIVVIGVLFLKDRQNEIFGGYKEVVVLEQSVTTIEDQLEKIAKDSNSLIAKRIIDSKDNISGKLENTYYPIGDGELPSILPLQTNTEIIKNSPNNTLYIIVEGDLTAQGLVEQLNAQNNQAQVFPTDYTLTLLKVMFSTPQSFMIVFVLLIAFTSLVLAEYISNIKAIGIRRMAGEGKHSIALKQTYRDSIFLVVYTLIIALVIFVALNSYNIFAVDYFLMIMVPILIWIFVLIAVNFFLSQVFYYVLQSQPINLSIKGKAPMKTIFLVVIVTQVLTLCSLMYCIYGLNGIDDEISSLRDGQQMWSNYPQLFSMSAIDDGGTVTKEQKRNFYEDLDKQVGILFVTSNLDNIALSNLPYKNTLSPTAEQVSNVLYVNDDFIRASGIDISKEVMEKIENLEPFENVVLIPEIQSEQYNQLKTAWIESIQKEAESAMKDNGYTNLEAQVSAAMYAKGSKIFTYPVFDDVGQIVSNDSFVHNPIIIVGRVYSNLYMYPDAWNLRVTDPNKVTALISEHQLNHALGSLTNGVFSINGRLEASENKKTILLVSTIISLISSILLLILLNTIYFYQGRKVFFIERLAGKSVIAIHKLYLSVVMSSNLLISLICIVLGAQLLVTLTPIIYMLLILGIFVWQLKRDKEANILYLKGE